MALSVWFDVLAASQPSPCGLRLGAPAPRGLPRRSCGATRAATSEFPPMDTPTGHEQNADQIAYWNGPGGQRWASRQQAQDIVLAPVADVLIDRAKPGTGERIIDVGCGSGAT